MPLVRALRTNGLRQRHWGKIYQSMPVLGLLYKSQLTLHSALNVSAP